MSDRPPTPSPPAPGPLLAADSEAQPRRAGDYVVVARRYRPQSFADLVGQEHVAEALAAAITAQRVGHAYLFTGARGVGKTSTARIFAKALNCTTGPTPQPCNRCDVCQAIGSGDDVDVLEIDGASNRGIDEMRELRQNVNVRPSRARFKIYIIDEVHMLTKEAFNALLKTLEEPPEHVKFIFCTTEPEKIPVTILSRCQRFDFAGIRTDAIRERLHQIAEAEGVAADEEALELIARRAAGSMRDSQSLLEQLLAVGGQRLSADDVHRLLGTAAEQRLSLVAERLLTRDAAAALGELDAAMATGVDVGQLLEQLLGYYRDVMVACVGGGPEAAIHTSRSGWPAVARCADEMGLENVLAVMQILDHTLARLRYTIHGRLLAELALVRICRLDDLEELGTLVASLRGGSSPPMASRPPSSGQAVQAAEAAKKKADPRDSTLVATGVPDHVSGSASLEVTPANIRALWEEVLAAMGDITGDQASLYDGVAISAPNVLVVTFQEKYTSCKSFCEHPERAARLEAAIRAAWGEPWRIEFQLVPDRPSPETAGQPKSRTHAPHERLRQVAQQSFVQRAIDLFEARPVRLDEADAAAEPRVP